MRLTSASWRRPACLPGPGLRDAGTEASLAGYGEYFRSTCQTDARGPMKYHYCQTDPLCMSEENCPPKFSDGLKSYSGCSKEDRTPARWSRLCSKFLYESKFEFRDDVDEVHLLEMDLEVKKEKGQYLETCYRQEPGHYGWCRTSGNFYTNKEEDVKKETRISTDWGWGFCSPDCSQNEDEESGVLRKVPDANILSQEFCDNFLKKLTPGNKKFKYKPKILCVARNQSLKYEVYSTKDSKEENTHWSKVEKKFLKRNDIVNRIYEANMVDLDQDGAYITSVGACKGDSGGPMFTKSHQHPGRHVLLGLTSGGRSHVTECGGVNNPTVYVRLKTLVPWIKKHVDSSDFCTE